MTRPHYGTELPPAILLGGAENAVAAARALVARGVEVVVVGEDRATAHHVRGVVSQRVGRVDENSLSTWLDGAGRRWEDAVVIPLADVALAQVVARHGELGERFRLAAMNPAVVTSMLDKQRTAELAAEAGVPVPRSWPIDESTDLDAILSEVQFPVLVKPKHTYELIRLLQRRFLWARDPEDLRLAVSQLAQLPGGFSVLEFVPGPDSLLSSYNALRHDGQTLGEFTKRIERRYPTNEGGGTYHEVVAVQETAELGRRFFDHVGIQGFANVEFKLDTRDGQRKVIECNYRLTAATSLAERAGFPIVWGIYTQAIGAPEEIGTAAPGHVQWYPLADLASAMSQRPRAIGSWFSAARRGPVLPYFSLRDPAPSVRHLRNATRGFVSRTLRRGRR